MRAILVAYAEPLIKILALKEDVQLEQLPEILKISEKDVCDVIEYLRDNGAVKYIETMGSGFSGIVSLEVTSKGAEIALDKRKFIENIETNYQQMNIHAPVQNISQVQGNHNSIKQTVDNSQYNILKQMIENDSELDEPKKKSLLGILEKFNTLKSSGENAMDLIKTVGGLAIKYVPLFFSLLK